MLFQSLVECAVMMPDLRKQWHHTKKIQRRRGCFGFYGKQGDYFASFGGWIPLVRTRHYKVRIFLYEIDGQPALNLYKKLSRRKTSELPQASLLYPLNVTPIGKVEPVVRTILGIDNENHSMILAGDVPNLLFN
jgi:hypothetical protein